MRKEYEEKQREEERRAALEEMERKRLQALEALEADKKEKEGDAEKQKEQKKKEFFARNKQKGGRIRTETQKGYDTMKEEKPKKFETAVLTSDSENEVRHVGWNETKMETPSAEKEVVQVSDMHDFYDDESAPTCMA